MRSSILARFLALLDRTDRWHDSCVDAFQQLRLPLLTSEAVLTELFHLVGDTRSEMEAAWRFVRSGALVLGTIESCGTAARARFDVALLDRPMILPMAPRVSGEA